MAISSESFKVCFNASDFISNLNLGMIFTFFLICKNNLDISNISDIYTFGISPRDTCKGVRGGNVKIWWQLPAVLSSLSKYWKLFSFWGKLQMTCTPRALANTKHFFCFKWELKLVTGGEDAALPSALIRSWLINKKPQK